MTKDKIDKNMTALLSLLNLPSRADYERLVTKIARLHGSLVNVNMKLDRLIAGQKQPGSRAGAKKRAARTTGKA